MNKVFPGFLGDFLPRKHENDIEFVSSKKPKYKANPDLQPQVEFYRGQAVTPGDRYLAVRRQFIITVIMIATMIILMIILMIITLIVIIR